MRGKASRQIDIFEIIERNTSSSIVVDHPAWACFETMTSGAWFSDDRCHRLLLWRAWGTAAPRALFVMLNPSVAGAEVEDPTLRQCIAFAQRWGCSGVNIVNLHSLIATDPRDLWRVEPEDRVASGRPLRGIGLQLEHDDLLREVIRRTSGVIVGAWGVVPRAAIERVEVVRELAREAQRSVSCLGQTSGGHPRHPCRLSRSTGLESLWSR